MAQMTRVSVRLSVLQREQMKRLAAKLSMRPSNVLRLALTRLAEEEGIKIRPTWRGGAQALALITLTLLYC